jgi:hypothetical protein
MKTKSITLICILIVAFSFGQNQLKENSSTKNNFVSENYIYKLFPTKNFWTFIKLNTRNGKMWQIHFSVKGDEERGILDLNSSSLVSIDKEVNGRFTLYPTENNFNFLLLDQIDGNTYQVQWSMDAANRGVIPIK